jgi:hypothetical protein
MVSPILNSEKKNNLKKNNNKKAFLVKRLYKTKTTVITVVFLLQSWLFNSPGFEEEY